MSDLNLTELGKILKEKRQDAGISSGDAARDLRKSAAYYSRLESGKERPARETLDKIFKLYNLPPEDRRLLEKIAGYATGSESAVKMTTENSLNLNFDPQKPVLFADGIFVTVSKYGVTLDFGQKITSTNQQQIIARIGINLEHAEDFHKLLGQQIAKVKKMSIEN